MLHAARAGHGQQSGNGDFTLSAAASEADLAPLHGTTQRSLRDIVGPLHAVVAQEGEESFEVLQQRQSEIGDVLVAAVEMAVGQREKLLLQRNGLFDQLLAFDGTIADAGSVAKTMPQAEEPRMQGQSVTAEAFRIGCPADFL